ncbi:hypothetical protein ALNOE001_06140 [Candidatus Methanobinarius endosymbioticus]|uniref:Uncharacterized protein n=1 Tax=Candidatus Methanobinarius endosymbioticus TaxID=2006182 RepID=A0A366ME31_9EURY|nr:hypothetical protein ALNOE001_06140 [Candidatus Methanobinarius endosymbioticus]
MKPALISSVTPPQRIACSPKRSVSVSSLKVVSRIPALDNPHALPIAKAISFAFPVASCSTAKRPGIPNPSK